MTRKYISKLVHYLLLVVIIIYLVSGLGITYYRSVEKLTLGLLTKPLSFLIHDYLLIPFIVLLVLHLCLVIGWKKR